MDRTGDGADSADDSGSSQPYPSTLPGIPEGSARQLFQRLQGPMEEDTLKSHFEKIIKVWHKQQRYKKTLKDNNDPKQLHHPHASHALALSQICPNNLNGGDVLTPLDLCDTISPSTDLVTAGYQGLHTGGLPIPNHGVPTMVPRSTSTFSQPGSSAMVHGNHLTSVSATPRPYVREGTYDKQHKTQQLNLMSGRNIQPGSHSGTDRGVRVGPGGTGMSVINGTQRSMVMARPGFQGANSPCMLPGGTSIGDFPNQHYQPHVQSYPYPMSRPHHPPHHPAYGGMRFIKERQLHQQRLPQPQFATSNPITPPVQPQQLQVPVSSPQSSSSQVQSQSSSPTLKHRGLIRNPQTGANRTMKQLPRQPQQIQPPGRLHPRLNGFSESESTTKVSSLNHSQQQRRYPSQPQTVSSTQLHSDTPPVMASSDHRQLQPPQKAGSQTQATSGQRIVIKNLKEKNSDHPTVQVREATRTNEPFEDNVLTNVSRSQPQLNNTESGDDCSGPLINHDSICKLSESSNHLEDYVQQEHQSSL